MVTLKKTLTSNLFQIAFLTILILGFVSPASASPVLDPPPPDLPETASKVYLPFVYKPADAYVSEIEVTQAVQNLSNPVLLVAGRPTVARVYARTYESSQLNGISATLRAYRNGNLIGQKTLNNGIASPQSVSMDTLRASATKSFNFSLDPSWIAAGSTTLVAEIGASSLAPETPDEAAFSKVASFNSVPGLNVIAVPIEIRDASNGRIYPADSSDYIQEALYRMYPVPSVNVSVHATYIYQLTGDKGAPYGSYTSWSTLLDEISTLKDTEGQPSSTVYYGIVPLEDTDGDSWIPQGGSFYTGIGWVGWRAAIGISNETVYGYFLGGDDTASHEIGHNFGRLHSPGCGAGNIDTSYPYVNGIIGQYGFKVSELPSQVVISSSSNDIMNYCTNQWISDYTYRGLYNDQVQALLRTSLPEQESVFIRATFDEKGALELKPVYSFVSRPADFKEASEYSVQFLNSAGEIVAENAVDLLHAEEDDLSLRAIRAVLPKPDQPFTSLRVLHNGQVLSSRLVSSEALLAASSAPDLIQSEDQLTIALSGFAQPALIQYSMDGGKAWTTYQADISGEDINIALADLPAGPLQFRVIFADGAGSYLLDWTP